MSRKIRLEYIHQTIVMTAEEDFLAMQAFYGDPRNEVPGHRDDTMILEPDELVSLLSTLNLLQLMMAQMRESSWRQYCEVLAGGFESDPK